MDKYTDVLGHEIVAGDEILYAMTLGRGAVLRWYRIIGEYNPPKNEWGDPSVEAELVFSPIKYDSRVGKVMLHPNLFCERAFRLGPRIYAI